MAWIFFECKSLEELNLSNFNMKNVIYKEFMFDECSDKLIKKIRVQFKDI